MNKTTNTVDITNLSDAALDALLSIKAGDENVDAEALTVADRFALAAALGWEMNSYTRSWCANSDGASTASFGGDYEEAILAAQDAAVEG